MKYDEQILLKAAERFEGQAKRIMISCAIRYGLAAAILGGGGAIGAQADTTVIAAAAGAGLVSGVLIGIWRGKRLAFQFIVEAQKLIALVQINANTCKVEAVAVGR